MNKELFNRNPEAFIERIVYDFVAKNPANRLTAFDNEPIFDEPIVGFADGDDPLFSQYKEIIGEFHMTPRQVWAKNFVERPKPAKLSVVSFILPITLATRISLRNESRVVSRRWNHTRFQGQDFINELCRHLVATIEKLGYHAVAPELTQTFARKEMDNGPASNWSQRHVAYVAGLGTFSLCDGFITPKGIAMRVGSVVTDIVLASSPRPYPNHLSNCLFYRDGSCGRCIERCPTGAISEKGHDKKMCGSYSSGDAQRPVLKELGRDGLIGPFPVCGLCLTKVPCESRIP